jgi:drug/metabolite transporter (DMT)-like permease
LRVSAAFHHGHSHPDPLLRGGALALLAAVAFGLTTPLIQRFGRGVGSVPTAALLYAGAALASLDSFASTSGREAPVRRAHFTRLAAVALVGAVFAPICLTWGLQHESATSASLLLNFEAVFTVLLAWGFYREPIGGRVALALAAMIAGGAFLVLGRGSALGGFGLGAGAVLLATLGWALDNTLARPLAELSPTQVVKWKGVLGAAFSVGLALALGQPFPKPLPLLALLACGATGYGLSLRLYLRAQRAIGAARTGSIFAVAPFVGAGAAWLMGDRSTGAWAIAAASLFGLGVYLHLTEAHRHRHTHQPMAHEHAHRHDDGHHDHAHVPPVTGEHSHPHQHDARSHEHAHAPDIHHRHGHE